MISINCQDKKFKKLLNDFLIFKFPQNFEIEEIFFDIEFINQICIFTIKYSNQEKIYKLKYAEKHSLLKVIKKIILIYFDGIVNYDKSFGILTGVRPLKLYRKIRKDNNLEACQRILKEDYLLRQADINILSEIYDNQREIVENSSIDSYSIYIHIPFCPSRCSYCSFDAMVIDEEKIDIYIEALLKELSSLKNYYNKNPKTIYIGGGTPSSIGWKRLEKIIDEVYKDYGFADEFTVECGRTDTFSSDLLRMLKEKGVERISINPQSFNKEIIRNLNRDNTNFDFWYEEARNHNFKSINMDLIVGLPGENRDSIINSIKKVNDLEPDNITIHTLSLKKGSRLYDENFINDKDYWDVMEFSKKFMEENNYFPYYLYRQKRMALSGENIGYAKQGHICKYNVISMEEIEDILGFGISSSSKIMDKNHNFKRTFNYKSLNDYINRINDIILMKSSLIEKKDE